MMRVIKGHYYLVSNMVIVPQKSGNILESEIYVELFDLNCHSSAGCLNMRLQNKSEIEELFDEDSMYSEFVSNIK